MPLDRTLWKRIAHGAKKPFKPGGRAPTSDTPPPQVPPTGPSSQLTPSHEPVPALLPQPPALSQEPAVLSQPAPSASQPTPGTSYLANASNQPTNRESKLAQAAKTAGADAWAGLKATLHLLERSSDIFPTLKSAVAEFLGVVGTFETAAQNRNDYAELASKLQNVIREFTERPGEYTSSRMSEALQVMASGLEKEMEHVQEQQQRSRFKRHVGAGQDQVDVRECYRRVETLRRELQDKALVDIWRNQEEQKVDARLKELNAALKAMYDSSLADIVGRRTCTPGTREAIFTEMREWANNPESPKVYWLNGMAGTGKTTLAYSFCAMLQSERRLGASFFCSRADADSRDVSRIVPTISHQLARLLPSYREALIRKIGQDKEIGARRTETQFEKLIRDPLREVVASVPEGIIIMIDALDECDRRDGAREILNVLFLYARDLPVKFFVTCRPEPGLFDALQSQETHHRSVLHLHDIEASFVQADIKRYLEDELAESSLSPEKLGMLAEQAGALFIYAATAVRYIRPKNRQVNVHKHLDNLLSIGSMTGTNKHKGIDELYIAVLSAPFADDGLEAWEKENIRLVLDTAICAREPMSITTMAKLLEWDDENDVELALQHLRSVLHVSQGTSLISTLHASFPDFMLDQNRSKDLCCNAPIHSRHLALGCFNTMRCLLQFNICKLESSFILDEYLPDLAERINNAVLPELFYACRYWGDHLRFSEAPGGDHSMLEDFLSNRLLFWMEVLNLRKCIGAGAQMLNQAYVWLQKSGGTNDILELALDAGRFVTAFGLSPASRSTPHIYISALCFWPRRRPVRVWYSQRTQGLIRPEGAGIEGRDMSCLAAWDADSPVFCVAYSPDGTRIVSGSYDNSVRVWDARSGLLAARPFEGHVASVRSAAFSPDSTRVVSGSYDNTICVWDAHSGLVVAGPFKGHTWPVQSVAFSSNGARIVSGSSDKTICVWDAQSGILVSGPFRGHDDEVKSVAFSPDDTRIVSGSNDCTVCVWDAHSGLLVAGPLEGHTKAVNCVVFSPDGTRIVSGSMDKTICVWDAQSGLLAAGPFGGHTHWIMSVAFLSDGTRIVSGSRDGIVRVWDAQSGLLVAGPFKGHTNAIYSVASSSDGTRIVSGSNDCTIRVWDAQSGLLNIGPFERHTDFVESMALSPNGTRIVSGSSDKTICVWDVQSGHLVAGPLKGHTDSVYCVAFSSDGTHIVSGSNDHTVCVWDAHSGRLVAGPLEGHTDSILSVMFSFDNTRIVSGSHDATTRVWNVHSERLVAGPFQGHTGSINSVGFSPNGTHIVSGSSDKTICVWDVCNGYLAVGPFEGHGSSVYSVAFSPDGTRIVSGSNDHTVRVWDAHSGLLVVGPFEGHTDLISSVVFSSDGTRIASGSDDHTIRVWDARSGLLIAGPFEGHTDNIMSMVFSPDDTHIVSSSRDNAIRIWATTPHQLYDPGRFKDWIMDKTGMITTRQGQLLLCVPLDLWTGLVRPQNTDCIYARGVLKLDFDDVSLGNEWTKCYQ